ncbi:hypothetical protein GWI33_010610 [Rhynchophorus ferrugineus]|uniref:Uncharacterized protein n=1 Tax=Rhynchophorus ferrugineus TaxID=354439 RepID=A0A834MK90_RHYFE|nr:hypothetical protein GWI33_010610 [Rhynchophorus ferrugineus]
MKVCVVLFRKLTFHFILINPTHDTESVGSTGEKTEDRWANGATPLNSRNARPNDQDYGTIGASRMSQISVVKFPKNQIVAKGEQFRLHD